MSQAVDDGKTNHHWSVENLYRKVKKDWKNRAIERKGGEKFFYIK